MPKVNKPKPKKVPGRCSAIPEEPIETRLLYCRMMLSVHGWLSDGDMEKSQRRYLKKKEGGEYGD